MGPIQQGTFLDYIMIIITFLLRVAQTCPQDNSFYLSYSIAQKSNILAFRVFHQYNKKETMFTVLRVTACKYKKCTLNRLKMYIMKLFGTKTSR